MCVHELEVECIERNVIIRPSIISSFHHSSKQDNSASFTSTGNTESKTWKQYVLSEG